MRGCVNNITLKIMLKVGLVYLEVIYYFKMACDILYSAFGKSLCTYKRCWK
jgi:hypothetical protein